jgi:hypothetical protein
MMIRGEADLLHFASPWGRSGIQSSYFLQFCNSVLSISTTMTHAKVCENLARAGAQGNIAKASMTASEPVGAQAGRCYRHSQKAWQLLVN